VVQWWAACDMMWSRMWSIGGLCFDHVETSVTEFLFVIVHLVGW
jgi:hypothetical protein